jgi:RNA polymerase sigma factor (sigma-70 family)
MTDSHDDPWRRVPNGREPADLDQFWDAYEPFLRSYAGRLLSIWAVPDRAADVDDVTHDAYADLRAEWPEVRTPAAYVRSRAGASVFRALRDETRRGRPRMTDCGNGPEPNEAATEDPGPDEIVVEQHIELALKAALPDAFAELTPKQRTAVELTTKGELSRMEVATVMRLSPGAVSSHRARGLAKLLAVLLPLVMCYPDMHMMMCCFH